MAKKKYYVIWKGHKKGVFSSWDACKKSVAGFEKAQYKSFATKKEAALAFTKNYVDFVGKNTKTATVSNADKEKYGKPNLESISVDAACSGNPGKMEYQGVLTRNKQVIFNNGPFKNGTNNIGEFLALVHGLALLKSKGKESIPIYSDSKIAIGWVKKKRCNTKLNFDSSNKKLFKLIQRAEKWLDENSFATPILKWETKVWGEIPADFGRK